MTQPEHFPEKVTKEDLLAVLSETAIDAYERRRLPGNTYQTSREMLACQVRQTLESMLMLVLQGGPDVFLAALESALGLQSSGVLDGEGEKHTVAWQGVEVGDHSQALLDQCRGYGAGSMAMISYNSDNVPIAAVLVYDDSEMLTEILKAIQIIEAETPSPEGYDHSKGHELHQLD